MTKICEICNEEYEAKRKDQRICKNEHYSECPICKKRFKIKNPYTWLGGSKTCSAKCGLEQQKLTNLERYGVEFPMQSKEILETYKNNYKELHGVDWPFQNSEIQEKSKKTNLEKYGAENVFQSDEIKEKIKQSNIEKYGTPSAIQNKEVQAKAMKAQEEKYGGVGYSSPILLEKVRQTNLERYGDTSYSRTEQFRQHQKELYQNSEFKERVQSKMRKTSLEKYGVEYPSQSEEFQIKRLNTCIEKYGVGSYSQTDEFLDKVKAHSREKYGVDYPVQSKEVLHSRLMHRKNSSDLETRLQNIFDCYNIKYEREYVIQKGDKTHSYDFYLPDYKVLVETDGQYWHGYLTENVPVDIDKYEACRLDLVPEDHILHVIHESTFEHGLKDLEKILAQMDNKLFNYDSEVFKWCREIEFPYPEFSDKQLQQSYSNLVKTDVVTYKPTNRTGINIINYFHKSLYKCHVKGQKSPIDAWNDDVILKKVIANRLIYKNTLDPSRVLTGFSVMKKGQKVSMFNPVLTKYLVQKYLSDCSEIFDPFSGFSGRLLGSVAAHKYYIGQDLNSNAVDESNEIIKYFNLPNCSVSQKDILDSKGEYECLLTCPPYIDKEIYNDEVVFKSCDNWIDECLQRFKCKHYIFVVDETFKYKDNVVETLENKSHFGTNYEYVLKF